MHVVRSAVRTLKLGWYFLRFGVELAVTQPKTRQAQADWLHRFCRTAMRGLGLPLTVEGTYPTRGALISNHLGYLDIVVYAALSPCVFVSKAEIEHWPLLGWFARMSGTVFVERGKGGSAARAVAGLKAASEAGIPVVFFPEGTTTNGQELLPFHSGLLAQVLEAGEPVTPAFVQYALNPAAARMNGPGVSAQDDVCYWGDINIVKHIFRFFGLYGASGHVRIGSEPIHFSVGTEQRKVAADEARGAVLALSDGVLALSSGEPAKHA